MLPLLAALLAIGCRPEGAGVVWPRFPLDPATRSERTLAVVYSTGMLGPNTTLADLGYPGRKLFRLHREHPRLRAILRSCPASRYSGERSVLESPGASDSWKALGTDPRFDWIEIANQGYTHSPPGDSNLHHHEFSTTQEGCNLDHAVFGETAYIEERMERIRTVYRELGIPVSLILFPGFEHSARALAAASESGFHAVLGRADPAAPFRERWVPAAGREVLLVPVTWIRAGDDPPGSPGHLDSVESLIRVAEAASDGGILILSDTFSETFERIGGDAPRYLVLDAALAHAESRHPGAVWYPRGRDLALWLHARRFSRVDARSDGERVEARIEPPEDWPGLDGATVILRLPRDWEDLQSVRIDDGAGWREVDRSLYWLRREGVAIVFPLVGPVTLQAVRGD